jgi:hypothetical protein
LTPVSVTLNLMVTGGSFTSYVSICVFTPVSPAVLPLMMSALLSEMVTEPATNVSPAGSVSTNENGYATPVDAAECRTVRVNTTTVPGNPDAGTTVIGVAENSSCAWPTSTVSDDGDTVTGEPAALTAPVTVIKDGLPVFAVTAATNPEIVQEMTRRLSLPSPVMPPVVTDPKSNVTDVDDTVWAELVNATGVVTKVPISVTVAWSILKTPAAPFEFTVTVNVPYVVPASS